MPRKLTKTEREGMTFTRGNQIVVDEKWFDGDVWAFETADMAPHTPEIYRQLIRNAAVKRGHKIATKIEEGVVYIQTVPEGTEVVESDAS